MAISSFDSFRFKLSDSNAQNAAPDELDPSSNPVEVERDELIDQFLLRFPQFKPYQEAIKSHCTDKVSFRLNADKWRRVKQR